VHVARGGELDLSGGTVEQAMFGACLEDSTFDTSRLMHNVRFHNNGASISAVALPVPDLADISL
jgi:hypothetical protein